LRKLSLWVLILILAGALGGALAYALRTYVDAASVLQGITGQRIPATALPTYTPAPTPRSLTPLPTPTPTLPPVKNPTGVTNYLLLASDTDAKFNVYKNTTSAPDTQVMIFVSYNSTDNQMNVISIPRDLYVMIPGYRMDKIYTAAEYGDLSLAEQTVEQTFHVTIDHYAWVGLQGFVGIINAIGGVDIDVMHPMIENDFPNDLNPNGNPYSYRRFYIPAGPQHLDGITALLYVRARHGDLIGDYGRQQRQQQLLAQVKAKLKTNDILAIAPSIIESLKGEFKTDLTLPELLGLGKTLLGLPNSNIHRYYMTQAGGYTTDSTITTSPGVQEDVLLPNLPKMTALFACVLSPQAIKGCQ
jgi:LCP family protein required for cell wall assembly